MSISLISVTLHSRTQEFCRSHQITRICQKVFVERKFERGQNVINNKTFLVYYPEKGYPVIQCMNVYKEKIQFDGSLDKLKFSIEVRRYLQNS